MLWNIRATKNNQRTTPKREREERDRSFFISLHFVSFRRPRKKRVEARFFFLFDLVFFFCFSSRTFFFSSFFCPPSKTPDNSAKGAKHVYYLSAEFLMGRSLTNAVFNLGLEGAYGEAVKVRKK